MFRLWITIGALLGATGIAMAAFTSHGLGFISAPDAREAARISMQSAVNNQLLHAVVLIVIGLWFRVTGGSKTLLVAAILASAGVLLFSGLIYLQTLTSVQSLRQFVPWGGTSFILAWFTIALAAWQEKPLSTK